MPQLIYPSNGANNSTSKRCCEDVLRYYVKCSEQWPAKSKYEGFSHHSFSPHLEETVNTNDTLISKRPPPQILKITPAVTFLRPEFHHFTHWLLLPSSSAGSLPLAPEAPNCLAWHGWRIAGFHSFELSFYLLRPSLNGFRGSHCQKFQFQTFSFVPSLTGLTLPSLYVTPIFQTRALCFRHTGPLTVPREPQEHPQLWLSCLGQMPTSHSWSHHLRAQGMILLLQKAVRSLTSIATSVLNS